MNVIVVIIIIKYLINLKGMVSLLFFFGMRRLEDYFFSL